MGQGILIDDGCFFTMFQAAILQQTSEYIGSLESEKTRLLTQNEQLKRMMAEMSRENEQQISPPPKRKKRDTGTDLHLEKYWKFSSNTMIGQN